MTKRKIFELILNTSGFDIEKFEMIVANGMVGYQFEASINGKCQFQIATDSFGDAIEDTLRQIYNTQNVEFEFKPLK